MLYDVIIIGAGISGLTAAYQLSQHSGVNLLLIEATELGGGMIHTVGSHGYQTECGPNSFPGKPAIMSLCEDLGLSPLPAADHSRNKYILYRGKLHKIPTRPMELLTSSLLSPKGKARLLMEPFQAAYDSEDDETIAHFTRRRLGQEVLNNLLGPFISGIYAGDPESLSVQSVFPQFSQWESSFGSLFKGMIAAKKGSPKKSGSGLYSFSNGLQTLPQTMLSKIPPQNCFFGTRVLAVEKKDNHYVLILSSGQSLETKSVIFATPAPVTARLLGMLDLRVATVLSNIAYCHLSVVQLGIRYTQLPKPLKGFGFLVSKQEASPLLGCIWSSSLFPNRAPQGYELLTCYVGGALYPELSEKPDETLYYHALKGVQAAFNNPFLYIEFLKVHRHPRAIPQYTVGHAERINQLNQFLQKLPGISLCGNYLNGVSLDSCIQSGQAAAKQTHLYIQQSVNSDTPNIKI